MSGSRDTEIRGDNGHLGLEILDYENPQSESLDDRNWLEARLAVSSGPFSGSIRLTITAAELEVLQQRVASATKALTGEVSFTNMEGDWTFELKFERSGEAVISGSVTPNLVENTSLRYGFRTDAISLEAFVRGLRTLTTEFPAAYV